MRANRFKMHCSAYVLGTLILAQPGLAYTDDTATVAEGDDAPVGIIVFGRGEQLIDTATQASQGTIEGADLRVRPLSRIGEIVEAVPGMIATQHSGGGKANQYFLRGFNLDHGTDFTFSYDDVPLNFRTHGHGQGYLDLNHLIPETINRIDYRKGPYRADVGDFALVGAAQATTIDTAAPFASAEGGSYGYARIVAGGSGKVGNGDLLLAGQFKANDGKWELPERLRNYSGYAKYSTDVGAGRLAISFSAYDAQWRPTEQVPERAIPTLLSGNPYGTLDSNLRGESSRYIAAIGYRDDDWRISLYAQRYRFNLISNSTFFLDDPVDGDQIEQADSRSVFGGKIQRRFAANDQVSFLIGAEARHDDIGNVGLYGAVDGQRNSIRNQFKVRETSGGVFGEVEWKPFESLNITAGLRGETYRFQTRGTGGADWSGKVSDSILLPKIGASYRIAPGIAFYANYGEGFHSNDARGVTEPTTPAPGLVRGHGAEVGARVERGGFVGTVTLWTMRVGSELVFVGDAGSVEPGGASKRGGYEITAFYKPASWLALDAVWTGSRSRFLDSPGADRIPGALRNAGEAGASVIFDRWNAGLRVRHLGKSALIEDNSVKGSPTTLVNMRAAFTPGRFEIFGELLNIFDKRDKDIQYFYTSRLPGEPAGGVDDIHSRVVEPFTARVGAKITF